MSEKARGGKGIRRRIDAKKGGKEKKMEKVANQAHFLRYLSDVKRGSVQKNL